MSAGADHKCQHCWDDPHCPNVWPPVQGEIQLYGVWLCWSHYERAVVVRGHLLSPMTAREVMCNDETEHS